MFMPYRRLLLKTLRPSALVLKLFLMMYLCSIKGSSTAPNIHCTQKRVHLITFTPDNEFNSSSHSKNLDAVKVGALLYMSTDNPNILIKKQK